MKIFSWMQRKLNGKQGAQRPNSISAIHRTLQEPRKEEFSDWPHGLLAIGTFGSNSLKEDPEICNFQGSQSSAQDQLQDISPEEVVELQKELTLLMHKLGTHNLQLDSINFTKYLEDERSNSDTVCGDSADRSGQLLCSTSVIPNRGKEIRADQTKNAISKRSLSFLLKKIFLCRNGFSPSPNFRDPIPDKSRMERILRAILHRKIYPYSSSPKATAKNKYLETSLKDQTDGEDEMLDKENDGSKWVKTDSEFIVLEI